MEKRIEEILEEYGTNNEESDYEKLLKLDRKVKEPALILSLILGIIETLVLGFSMCIILDVISFSFPLVIVFGVVAIILLAINYPLYNFILKYRKNAYRNEIVELANKALNN